MTARPAGLDDAAAQATLEQAAHWYALLRSGEATRADEARWRDWLAASAANRDAWAQVERISQRFSPLRDSPDPQAAAGVLTTARQRLNHRRHLLRSVAVVAGGGLLGWGTWRCTDLPLLAARWRADHRAPLHALSTHLLADGSRVWLAPGSAINVRFDAQERRVQLLDGQLFIETAPDDAQRRFLVDTPLGRLRALGTRFHVRLHPEAQGTLAVYDGAVELHTAGADAHAVVQAGEQRRFGVQAIEDTQQADAAGQLWTRGILLAQDMALREVIAELARYHAGRLAVTNEVGRLRVHGSFPLGNTERSLAMLAAILPIQWRQPLPWWITVDASR